MAEDTAGMLESRSDATRRARAVSLCACARRAGAHTARDAARDDMRLDDEWLGCCALVHKQDERVQKRRAALARDAAHLSLSHAYIFSVSSQAVDATAFPLD